LTLHGRPMIPQAASAGSHAVGVARSARPAEGAGTGGGRLPPVSVFAILATALLVPVGLVALLGFGLGSGGPLTTPAIRLWPCLVTAMVAGLLSAWIWALRPSERAAMLFCASGAATYAFCLGAALFLLPGPFGETTLTVAAFLNVFGASGFGIIMIALFALYPRRLPGAAGVILVSIIFFGGWTVLGFFGPFDTSVQTHRVTLAEMALILVLAGAQVLATRADPVAHAIAVWLGTCVAIGAGAFIGLVALPSALLLPPLVDEEFGFLFFIIIYVALAVALLRYRVFGLGRWAFQLLFVVGAGLAVLVVDAAIVLLLSLDPARATGIALLMVALVYLPARGWLWQRLVGSPRRDQALLFREVAGVALEPTPQARAAAWGELLRETFSPLELSEAGAPGDTAPRVAAEGCALLVPGPAGFPSLLLRDRDHGRRLFTPADAALAGELVGLVTALGEARSAYDRGVATERARIAQDIHDNIGAHLLTALHAPATARKDELIRETIGDLRDVIRNAEGEAQGLDALVGDLRAETADRLELAGFALSWNMAELPEAPPPRDTVRALRAVLREAVSNALRHSGGTTLQIAVGIAPAPSGPMLALSIADDGQGFDGELPRSGRGLGNMQRRIEALGGTLVVTTGTDGTRIAATLPL